VTGMRAIWSFWSKPAQTGTAWPWGSPLHHLLAWGLSVRLARRHYPQTALVTDTAGKALLVDALGLPFEAVSTELDTLRDADPALWALGKLVAYSVQHAPFVHLDTDVFLWQPLPAALAGAAVFAQHLDEFAVTPGCGPRVIENAFHANGLTLPAEWQWYRSHQVRRYREANCGIIGGTSPGLIRHAASVALRLALDPAHRATWEAMDRVWLNPTVEQFVLSACVDYHRFNPASPHAGSHPRYLFPSAAHVWDAGYARRVGYTHLLGPAKQHPETMARLVSRVRTEDPGYYARCVALCAG
jgi:Family of unknown function (DUF6734)